MTIWLLLGGLVSAVGALYLTRHRHHPILTLKRDEQGDPVVPAVIVWVCADCQQVIGETHALRKDAA
jgi:hypothetical protein